MLNLRESIDKLSAALPCAVLLAAAAFCAPALSQGIKAPPPGFRTQVMDPTDGRINVPADWTYTSKGTQSGWLWTFAKDRTESDGYDTGFSIQLLLRVREAGQSSPQAFATSLLQTKREGARIVRECPTQNVGEYMRQCIEVVENLQRGFRTRPFRLLYSVFWSDEKDQVIVTTFGTPENEWSKWEATVATMAEFQLIGQQMGR